MITEWFIAVGTSIGSWFAGILPGFVVPAWFGQLGTNVNQFFTSAAGLNPFVDWTFLATIASVPIGLWSLGMLFRLARWVLSHVPFFGGH